MITDISKPREPFFDGSAVHHSCHTLRYILQGNGTMELNRQTTIPLSPGTIVFGPAHTLQQSFSQDGMVDIVIYLTQFDIGQKDGNQLLVLQDDITQTGFHCFSMLYNIFQQRNVFLEPLLNSVYKNLYQFIEQLYVQSTYDPRILSVTKHLHALFTQPDLSVEQILTSQGQSSDYLRRLFKKTHGCTPVQYLNKLRIGRAKRIIEGNCLHHLSITQIAEQSGFSDASYFSRVFREHLGLSPTQYEQLFPGNIDPDPNFLKKLEIRG
ncbi:MAG: helix-turn-helix domain-containing protein [Clostridia bacterium]|nr:helix-turn-helix domain-containing protein [Clostridia bacterium]